MADPWDDAAAHYHAAPSPGAAPSASGGNEDWKLWTQNDTPESSKPGFWETFGHDINPMNSVPALYHGALDTLTGKNLEAGIKRPNLTPAIKDGQVVIPSPDTSPDALGHLAGGIANTAALSAVPAVADAAPIIKGAVKGGVKAAIEPVNFRGVDIPGGATLAGATAGHIVGGPVGAFVGGSIPFVKGAINGVKEAQRADWPPMLEEPLKRNPNIMRKLGKGRSAENYDTPAYGPAVRQTGTPALEQPPVKMPSSSNSPAPPPYQGPLKVNPNIAKKMRFTPGGEDQYQGSAGDQPGATLGTRAEMMRQQRLKAQALQGETMAQRMGRAISQGQDQQ